MQMGVPGNQQQEGQPQGNANEDDPVQPMNDNMEDNLGMVIQQGLDLNNMADEEDAELGSINMSDHSGNTDNSVNQGDMPIYLNAPMPVNDGEQNNGEQNSDGEQDADQEAEMVILGLPAFSQGQTRTFFQMRFRKMT